MATARLAPDGDREGGFTLLEILVSLSILVVGSVGVIALFAAAVQLQYKSAIEDRLSLLLPEIEAHAQEVVNRFEYSEETPIPEEIDWTDAPDGSGYRYRVKFIAADAGLALPGEGYWIDVKIEPPGGGKAIDYFRLWFLKRQLFAAQELERSVTWEREREGGEDRDVRERRDEIEDR